MVDFLVFVQALIDLLLYRPYLPINCERAVKYIWILFSTLLDCSLNNSFSSSLSFFLYRFKISETIIFKGKSNNFDITTLHVEIITSICWLVRPQRHWVFVRSKHQILFPYYSTKIRSSYRFKALSFCFFFILLAHMPLVLNWLNLLHFYFTFFIFKLIVILIIRVIISIRVLLL
jgi:hypothetical protein